MRFFPKNQKQAQKFFFQLACLLVISLILIGYLTIKVIKLRKAPPFLPVGTLKTDTINIPCSQRTDLSGWEIKNGRLVTYPHCLTVSNSRFGSRFNFDWYFGEQKVKSSVMGTLEDADIGLGIELIDSQGNKQTIFPASPNSPFIRQTNELGLTYQKISFESDQATVTLTIHSPFSPSKSAEDKAVKLSSAPFFYLELEVLPKLSLNPNLKKYNLLPYPDPGSEKPTLNFTLSSPGELENNRIYFSDPTRRDGQRVLASLDSRTEAFIAGNRGGFAIPLTSNHSKSTTLIYAGWLPGGVVTDIRNPENKQISQFNYINIFQNIDEVIDYATSKYSFISTKTSAFEKDFQKTDLTPQQKWLAAQAFHSYIGNSWLTNKGFFVWEGEFKYLNTLDVAHDYDVLAGLYFPWVIRSELEGWAESVKEDEFGKVIPHDLGVRFEYKGRQEYAIPGSETSGMPVEENTNFILLAWWYYSQTKDQKTLISLIPLIHDLCDSLIARDTNNNGIADTGIGMTTYDNDGNPALKAGPDSSYLAVKELAAYLSAEKIFETTDDKENQQKVKQEAEKIADTLKKAYAEYGFIPLSLAPDKNSTADQKQSFAFINGLFYPALTSLKSPILTDLQPIFGDSYKQAYEKSLVKNADGKAFGLQLAEIQTLHLGWFSHSVMADYIAKKLFGQNYDSTQYWFPLLYDNPNAFADGQYFHEPGKPETTLIFYPRGAAIFSILDMLR